MTIKIFKYFSLSLFLVVLMACQNQSNIRPTANETLDWTQLQKNTLTELREKNYGQASVHIAAMISQAENKHDDWEYIRMALVSMPIDLAAPLIDESLKNTFVKNNSDELFGFSRVLTQLKQKDHAIKLINQAIKQHKKDEFVYWRARLMLLTKNEELAEKDYQWLLQKDPQNTDYISQYATLLSFLKRDDEAIALLSSNENEPSLLFRQVVLLLQSSKDELADKKFAELKALIVDQTLSNEQYLEIGELAFWLKDYETSLNLLQQVKSGDDLNVAKLLMAQVLTQQKDYDRAVILFRQVQNGPETHAIPAYLHEIELFRNQDKFTQAIDVASMGLKMFPDDADLLYSRAMLYEQVDDIDSLENDLMAIINKDPQNPDALNALGYSWIERDMNIEQSYDYIMQAYAIKPNDKAILDSVGWVYYKKGDLDQAEKYLRMAVEDNERDVESFEHLVIVLKALGKEVEAQDIEAQISELFPKD